MSPQDKPATPFQEWKLKRLAKRANLVRGTVINLVWLDASQAWLDYHTKVCGREDCKHGEWNLIKVPSPVDK